MKQLFILLLVLAYYSSSYAQSKKEEIQILNHRIDSLKIVYANEKDFLTNEIHVLKTNVLELHSKLNITDSLKIANITANALLTIQINELITDVNELETKLNYSEQNLAETKERNKILKRNYEDVNQTRLLDSLKYTHEIDYYIEKIDKVYDSINQSKLYLSNWFMKNLNISIPDVHIEELVIQDLSEEIKSQLLESEFWLANVQVVELTNANQVLKLDLSDENYVKRLFLSSNYLIVSYHLTFGSDGHSLLIDLKQMNSTFLEGLLVTEIDIKGDLIVEKDYYDDEGHVWETGSYDIKSQRYRMLSKEH